MVKKEIQKKEKIDEVSDVVYEEESAIDPTKKLRERLKRCVKEKQEYLDGWQRAKADFQNFKKEVDKDKKRISDMAKEEILMDILPVIDSFNLAFANKDAWESVDKNWRNGVEYIYSQLKTVLKQNNVKEINPIGQKFNPLEHNSTEVVEVEDKKKDNTVAEVIQVGYSMDDRIIRPARVKVAQYKPKSEINKN